MIEYIQFNILTVSQDISDDLQIKFLPMRELTPTRRAFIRRVEMRDTTLTFAQVQAFFCLSKSVPPEDVAEDATEAEKEDNKKFNEMLATFDQLAATFAADVLEEPLRNVPWEPIALVDSQGCVGGGTSSNWAGPRLVTDMKTIVIDAQKFWQSGQWQRDPENPSQCMYQTM